MTFLFLVSEIKEPFPDPSVTVTQCGRQLALLAYLGHEKIGSFCLAVDLGLVQFLGYLRAGF